MSETRIEGEVYMTEEQEQGTKSKAVQHIWGRLLDAETKHVVQDAIPLMDCESAFSALTQRPSPGVVSFLVQLEAREQQRRREKQQGVERQDVDWNNHLPSALVDEHQRQAINSIVNEMNDRALLAVEMGLGKTRMARFLAAHYGGMVLVIGPANKLDDYAEEWNVLAPIPNTPLLSIVRTQKEPLFADTTMKKTKKHQKTKKNNKAEADQVEEEEKEQKKPRVPPPRTIAMSYATASARADELAKITWRTIIVDESHALKNPEAGRTQNLIPIVKRALCVLLLTGTPELARPAELFTQMDALHPTLFTSREEFTTRYCRGHRNVYGAWVEEGSNHTDELHLLLSKMMVRYTKSTALPTLTPIVRQLVYINPPVASSDFSSPASSSAAAAVAFTHKSKKQKRDESENEVKELDHVTILQHEQETMAYLQNQVNILSRSSSTTTLPQAEGEGEGEGGKTKGKREASQYSRALQALFQQANHYWHCTGRAKTEWAKSWLLDKIAKSPPRDKFLLFCVHVDVLEKWSEILTEADISHVCVSGKVPVRKRKALLQEVKSTANTETRVALLTIRSSGTGIDISGAPNHVIFLELEQTPATMDQAVARAHRRGLASNFTIYVDILIAQHTRDEAIWKKLEFKAKTNTRVVDGNVCITSLFSPQGAGTQASGLSRRSAEPVSHFAYTATFEG